MLTFEDMKSYKKYYRRFDTTQPCAQDVHCKGCYEHYLQMASLLDDDPVKIDEEAIKNIRHVRAVHGIEDVRLWSADLAKPGEQNRLVGAAILAPLALDLLISSVSKGLTKERSKYSATYGQSGSFDDFWLVVKARQDNWASCIWEPQRGYLIQNYAGFELVRTTGMTDYKHPAFKIVFAFLPTSGGRLFRVVPLFQRILTSKAKVLRKTWWTVPWSWTFKAGSSIDVDVDVSIDGMWIVNHKYTKQSLFEETLSTQQYDIVKSPSESFPGIDLGFFPGVPVSEFMGKPVGRGVFRLEVRVTERDHSNADKILHQGVQQLSDKKDDWKKRLKDAVNSQAN